MKLVTVQSAWPNTLGGYFGKLICKWKGHKRGKRVPFPGANKEISLYMDDVVGNAQFECPRCGAQWTRKISKRKPKEPSNANG